MQSVKKYCVRIGTKEAKKQETHIIFHLRVLIKCALLLDDSKLVF